MDLECKSSHKKNGQLKFTLSIVKVLEQIYYYSLDKIQRKSLSTIIHDQIQRKSKYVQLMNLWKALTIAHVD